LLGFAVKMFHQPADVTFSFSSGRVHTHRAGELILMNQDHGHILIGKTTHPAAADQVLPQANVPHAFINTGAGPCGYFAIQWHRKKER